MEFIRNSFIESKQMNLPEMNKYHGLFKKHFYKKVRQKYMENEVDYKFVMISHKKSFVVDTLHKQ